MTIKRLVLNDFRNYDSVSVDFDKGVNIIYGNNAQGKTNLLEAIYFCSIGKSMRTNKEREVIKMGKEIAKIKVEIAQNNIKRTIEIVFSKKNKKTIKINGIAIHRIGELMGELPCVFFSPDGLKLIKESPEDRRRFMDIAISQTSKNYFYLLGKYDKVLDQRNKLLKSSANLEIIKNSVFIWNEQLADIGSKIIFSRINFLNALSPYAELAHTYLTNNDEKLNLSYLGVSPIVPNPKIIESRPSVKHTPCINGSINDELKAPDATPPESNAIDEICFGTTKDKTMQHNNTGK